jgi:hypothetical protein
MGSHDAPKSTVTTSAINTIWFHKISKLGF